MTEKELMEIRLIKNALIGVIEQTFSILESVKIAIDKVDAMLEEKDKKPSKILTFRKYD
jgi:hypothetical protein